jgi:hypothetical protein
VLEALIQLQRAPSAAPPADGRLGCGAYAAQRARLCIDFRKRKIGADCDHKLVLARGSATWCARKSDRCLPEERIGRCGRFLVQVVAEGVEVRPDAARGHVAEVPQAVRCESGRTREPWVGPSAYSTLTVLPGGRIACLYERAEANAYERITLAHFSLDWPARSIVPGNQTLS